MQSLAQLIQKTTNQMIRNKVQDSIEPGTIVNIVQQEINSIITDAFNQQLVHERDKYLKRLPYQRQSDSAYRNGYKPVKIPGLFGLMQLQKPVVRKGSFSSPLLNSLKTASKQFSHFLASWFWLRGTSTRDVAKGLNQAMGTKLSHSSISTITNVLESQVRQWEQQPITDDIAYLMLDAIYLPVRRPGFTSKQALLAALGITPTGKRKLLGFLLGDRESQDSWSDLINILLGRGLDRNNLQLVISDEHKGIIAAVSNVLAIPHQYCLAHKMRNIRQRVAAPERPEFMADVHDIFWADSKDHAFKALGHLEGKWKRSYPNAIRLTALNFDSYTQFFDQPKSFWTSLRTTNILERFNLELKRRLRAAGTMHSELEVMKLIFSISTLQEERWAKRKLHNFDSQQNMKKAA